MSITEQEIKVVVLVALVAFVLAATFLPDAVLMLCSAISPSTAEIQRLERAATIADFARRIHLLNLAVFLFLESTWSPLSKLWHLVFTSTPSEAVLFFLCILVIVLLQMIRKDITTALRSFFSRIGQSLLSEKVSARDHKH